MKQWTGCLKMNLMRRLCAMTLAMAVIVSLAVPCLAEDKDWWNILLLGGDSYGGDDYGRTDAMIVLSINRETFQIKMTSIMRDTWVQIPGCEEYNKINAANVFGGPELAMATVNECFGTDIADYVLVNMAGLVDVVDALGGVDIEITRSEMEETNALAAGYAYTIGYKGETSLEEYGMVHLNGLLAMSYARNRETDNDYGRVMRQQKVLLALAEKAKGMGFAELMNLAGTLPKYVQMNLDPGELISLIPVALAADFDAICQYRIPADGTYESGMHGDIWQIRPDLEANQRLLHAFIYGENAESSEEQAQELVEEILIED